MVLSEIDRLSKDRWSFAFESTLSGRSYLQRFKRLGYKIQFVFLRVASPQWALKRIASRVKHGGHDVPKTDVIRRFDRGWENFLDMYQPLADSWVVYENSGKIAISGGERSLDTASMAKSSTNRDFQKGVERALKRAAAEARRVARLHGTPIYIWENGKVVAKKP